MIAYIKGTLDHKGLDQAVVEAAGVGYRILTSLGTLQELPEPGSVVKILTHYHVREDAALLYGFLTRDELNVFELLITVSGVGPKAALSILSSMPPAKFSMAVIAGDAKALSRAQGVGLKTAQRIIIELGDKLKKEHAGLKTSHTPLPDNAPAYQASAAAEAISALVVLGYSQSDASMAVGSVYQDGMSLETLIMKALRGLSAV
ncbi:MAG TPA: Holliday junction branch migration protein RuvA [Clostridiales bacterium]|nr:Holliday junction branch migration protein RuvA [Clostridiales bacterium]